MRQQLNCLQRLVLPYRDLHQLDLSRDHVLVFKCRDELSFGVFDHAHLELALADARLPPPVLVVGQDRRFRGNV